jgi:hypothetical protein
LDFSFTNIEIENLGQSSPEPLEGLTRQTIFKKLPSLRIGKQHQQHLWQSQ